MAEIQITRTDVIVVDSVGKNDYGDLTWKDKAGKDYKVSAKRVQYFEKVILPNMAVKLSFAEAYNKEYIYKAELVSEKMAEKASEALEHKIEASKTEPQPAIPKRGASGEEQGMWWKEVGENFRAGLFKKDTGNGKLLWACYIAQMMASLDIKIEDVKKETKTE